MTGNSLVASIVIVLYDIIIGVSALVAILFRKEIATRSLLPLAFLLPYVFIQELIPDFFPFENSFIYNVYRPITVLVFLLIYSGIPFMKPRVKLMRWVTGIYLALVILNFTFLESIRDPGGYPGTLRNFVCTFFAFLFLIEYFKLDDRTLEKYWLPVLWVSIGIVIFYPVTSISITFRKFLIPRDIILFGMKVYHLIPQVMSIFMYSCFIYAFYLCRVRKSTLLSQ